MSEYQNHVIDPTFFYDAIEEFAFDFNIYVKSDQSDVDDYGRTKILFTIDTIRGSLQSQGTKIIRSKTGNIEVREYDFYCKSLYRINIGDFIEYKGNFHIVVSVNDYDEYGVRSAKLNMINLNSYRDLADYVKYLKGQKLV